MQARSAGRRLAGMPWRIILVVGLGAFAIFWLVTRDLFVLSEARSYSLYDPVLDPLRFLLQPQLDWGSGRLVGLLAYRVVGLGCGVDALCFNAVGAALAAIATGVLVIHTRQLTGSIGIALVAAALWITSPAIMGVALWQGTWFDFFAFIAFLGTTAIWWEVLGRSQLTRAGAVVFVIGSVALLAIAFNAKETTYALTLLLPMIAVLRGIAPAGRVRRNLVLTIIPVAYAVWFIAFGLTHISAEYAAKWVREPVVDGFVALLRNGLGLAAGFMYIEPQGSVIETLRRAGHVGFVLVGVLLVGLAMAALVARRRRGPGPAVVADTTDGGIAADVGQAGRIRRILAANAVPIYLAGVGLSTAAILAREGFPTSYYLLIPAWSLTALTLVVVRRLARELPHPRSVEALVVGPWLVTHAIVFISLLAPGSARDTLVTASDRMRDIGSTLRSVVAGKQVDTIAWRTIGLPDGDLLVLRDPGRSRPPGDPTWPVGQDMMPFLLQDAAWRHTVLSVPEGTVDEIRAGTLGLSKVGEVVVVIDAEYRLLLVLDEGRVVFEASSPGDGAPA